MKYPKCPDELTSRERAFFDSLMEKIPEGETIVERASRLENTDLSFDAQSDFTEEEFWRVGHCFTLRFWKWEAVGKKGEANWGYLLHPL